MNDKIMLADGTSMRYIRPDANGNPMVLYDGLLYVVVGHAVQEEDARNLTAVLSRLSTRRNTQELQRRQDPSPKRFQVVLGHDSFICGLDEDTGLIVSQSSVLTPYGPVSSIVCLDQPSMQELLIRHADGAVCEFRGDVWEREISFVAVPTQRLPSRAGVVVREGHVWAGRTPMARPTKVAAVYCMWGANGSAPRRPLSALTFRELFPVRWSRGVRAAASVTVTYMCAGTHKELVISHV